MSQSDPRWTYIKVGDTPNTMTLSQTRTVPDSRPHAPIGSK
jgi:hypothetical protein